MSLRVKKKLGIRKDVIEKEPNKKFIFAFEGEKTEKQYFLAIESNRIELGIKDIIQIESLERNDPTRSNQLEIVREVNSYLNNITSCQYSGEDIKLYLKAILNSYYSDYNSQKDHIRELIDESFYNDNYKENLKSFTYKLDELLGIEIPLDTFIEDIKNFTSGMEYDKGFDTVCIIIDRDSKSFTKEQYDSVIDICDKNNYKLGIANPCFEFWLLLHLTDCKEYLESDIFNNIRTSKRAKTFLEKCLTNKIGSYQKTRLKFQPFKAKINVAIQNEKLYCNDIYNLKNKIGSSIGSILSEIMN